MRMVLQPRRVSSTCALRLLTMREPYGTTDSHVRKCLRWALEWPLGHIPCKATVRSCWPCRCLNKKKKWQSAADGGGRRRRLGVKRTCAWGTVSWESAWRWVCAKNWNMLKRCVCYLFSSPLTIQYLPLRCVVTRWSQGLRGAARENGRKSDPYGGTIKVVADLQPSSKPGQDFITYSWLGPSSHTLSQCTECLTSLSLQQNQLSAWPLGWGVHCSNLQNWFFFER